ncbi:MAG: hypothetical protein A2081_00100 [Elusimicrobia bacterium GWC2_61_19]|nr:MAG: hypothetical protein A2081_00100 [Elusimicrobia bacterium GWC2_61_19]
MNYKLRIKHPSGAEFEAEGPVEFIQTEKEGFLGRLSGEPGTNRQKHYEEQPQAPAWNALTEAKNGLLILKNKHQNLKAGDAALLILAAERQLNMANSISAITLSKAIKASGYVPERIDRLLAKAHREGLVKASGTKRSRAYQITDKGLERVWLEARKLV